jgi:predicted glycosyltransferase
MVRGLVEKDQKWEDFGNIKTVNFMQSNELEATINKSEIVVSRPGYTSVMDLTILEKKVFFVPTPGQYEQEYLAKRLKDLGIAPSCKQEKFKPKKLNKVAVYKGLQTLSQQQVNFSELFSLFEGK